jgi:hypothetical protein
MHHTISDLGEAVGARTEEFEEAEVAEDLELLADFVADAAVFRGTSAGALWQLLG